MTELRFNGWVQDDVDSPSRVAQGLPVNRPEPFAAFTTPAFWDDPHISAQMLALHLDPTNHLASRSRAFIDSSADWLHQRLGLDIGSRLLDLGCGPGLYAQRFGARGVQVVGVDVSRSSIAHARSVAEREALPCHYLVGNYLACDLGSDYDAAILIYEDFCALSPEQRGLLLRRVHSALRPAGLLAFDVTAAPRFDEYHDKVHCEPDLMDGFWAERPYDGCRETFTYPDLRLVLERYTIRTSAATRQFWNWMHCLTPEQVVDEVISAGLRSPALYGDIAGAPLDRGAPSFAIVATS